MPACEFIDSNIWLYVLVLGGEAVADQKHHRASDLLNRVDKPVINLQIVREVCNPSPLDAVVATRGFFFKIVRSRTKCWRSSHRAQRGIASGARKRQCDRFADEAGGVVAVQVGAGLQLRGNRLDELRGTDARAEAAGCITRERQPVNHPENIVASRLARGGIGRRQTLVQLAGGHEAGAGLRARRVNRREGGSDKTCSHAGRGDHPAEERAVRIHDRMTGVEWLSAQYAAALVCGR